MELHIYPHYVENDLKNDESTQQLNSNNWKMY